MFVLLTPFSSSRDEDLRAFWAWKHFERPCRRRIEASHVETLCPVPYG